MAYHLGVDLGTTYTAVAVHQDGHAEIVGLGTRAASVPTVVFLRDDEVVLTGDSANRRAVSEPGRVAREFKRRLGDPTPILLGGAPYSPEALMAELLRSVVDTVAERQGGRPEAITLTHPANWGPYKLDLLAQTVRLAGLGEVATLSEPEAAAIHYASTARVEAGELVAVYDLGGGTFDAAVLRKHMHGFEILGTPEGIDRLGGVDFDQAVFGFVARALNGALDALDPDDPSTLASLARLRQECVDAKEALSGDSHTSVPVLLPGLQTEVRITRAELEAIIRPPLGETIRALRRVFESAGVAAEEITAVLLVGGSSRIPLVAELVEAELGRPIAVDVHPKHAVALGAALHATGRTGGEVDDVEGATDPPSSLISELSLAGATNGAALDGPPHCSQGTDPEPDELLPAALARHQGAGEGDAPSLVAPWATDGMWFPGDTPSVTSLVELAPLAPPTVAPIAHTGRPSAIPAPLPSPWEPTAVAPPTAPFRPRASPPSDRPKRRAPWPVVLPVALALVIALVAGGLFLSRGLSDEPTVSDDPVRYAFTPVALESGLVLARTWELSPGAGDRFHAVVRLSNATDAPVSDTFDEVIPKSLAPRVAAITFTPRFDELVQDDPVVRYRINALPPGEVFVFSYDIDVPAEGADFERLVRWAADQAAAVAALSAGDQGGELQVVRFLESLNILPERVELDEGERFSLQLVGTMDDGSPAPAAVIEAVAWSSLDSNIASVNDIGVVEGRRRGGTTVTAQAGDLAEKIVVTVTRPPASAPGGDPARDPGVSGGSPTPTSPGGSNPPPPAACADGLDNDGDGRIDRSDPGCTSARDGDEADPPPPPPPPPSAACADGRDNDRDGRSDFPSDPGCRSRFDNDEADPQPRPTTTLVTIPPTTTSQPSPSTTEPPQPTTTEAPPPPTSTTIPPPETPPA